MKRFYLLSLAVLCLWIGAGANEADAQFNFDWCWTFDFTSLTPEQISISYGSWVDKGVSTSAAGDLNIVWVPNPEWFPDAETFLASPSFIIVRFVRGESVSSDVTVQTAGVAFGLNVMINEVIPLAGDYLTPIQVVAPVTSAGSSLNITFQTSDVLIVDSITVAGIGPTAFPENPCDQSIGINTTTPGPTASPTLNATPTPTATPVSDWCAETETLFTDSRITKQICLDFRQSSHSWVMPQNQLGQSRGQYVPGEGFKSRSLRTANSGTAGDWRDEIRVHPPASWGFSCAVHAVAIEFSWSLWPQRTHDNSGLTLPGIGNSWDAAAIPGLNGLAMFDNASYCMNATNMTLISSTGLSTSGPGNGGGYVTIHSIRIGYSGAFNQPTPTMAPLPSATPTVTPTRTPLYPPTPVASDCFAGHTQPYHETLYVNLNGDVSMSQLITSRNCFYFVTVSDATFGDEAVTPDNLIFSPAPGVQQQWLRLGIDDRLPEDAFVFVHLGTEHPWGFSVNESDFSQTGTFKVVISLGGTDRYFIDNFSDTGLGDVFGELFATTVADYRTQVALIPTGTVSPTPPWSDANYIPTIYPSMTARAEQTLAAIYAIPGFRLTPDRSPIEGQSIVATPAAPGGGEQVIALLSTTVVEVRSLPSSLGAYVPSPNVAPLMGYIKWTMSCSSIYELLGTNWGTLACHVAVGFVLVAITAVVFITLKVIGLIFKVAVWIIGKIKAFIPFI